MQSYRTTFSARPEIAKEIKDLARRQGKSISAVVNDLLATALGKGLSPQAERPKFEVRARPLGLRPGLDPTRLNQILYDLEMEER
jgi:hypothetical protein